MAERTYRDLIVWQEAKELAVSIYATINDCKDYSFKDQLQRASVSVMNNVAEGFARHSDKSFRHFLLIARGSASEAESMVILAYELGYISNDNYRALIKKTDRVMRLLTSFTKKLSI